MKDIEHIDVAFILCPLNATGDLSTTGHNATGIVAMSTGGGGGDSGTTVTGTVASKVSFGLSVGGDVTVDTSSNIRTSGELSLGSGH